MRDKFKTKEYFREYLELDYRLREKRFNKIRNNEIAQERISIVTGDECLRSRRIIRAKYSMGESVENLVEDYLQALNFMHESWMILKLKAYKKGMYYNHYFNSNYVDMLDMLSLGIMLHQPKETFINLAKIIDKDEVKDMLFEFILSSQIERPPLVEESYSVIQYIPNDFKSLREAVREEDKTKAAKLVDKYFTKDWIKQVNKRSGGFKPDTDTGYCGYWNFYVAAISYLLDIDVSSFENNEYFPKDMYYYAKEKR